MAEKSGSMPTATAPPAGGYPELPPSYDESVGGAGKENLQRQILVSISNILLLLKVVLSILELLVIPRATCKLLRRLNNNSNLASKLSLCST